MTSYDVVDWGKPLQARAHETPRPLGKQVLMRLTHCGVCHTDVHVRDGHFDLGGGRKLDLSPQGYALPLTLGHEPIGAVAAVGDRVREVEIGQTYLVNPCLKASRAAASVVSISAAP